MKKIIRLTESDLLRIIKKVIKEQESQNDKFSEVDYYFDKDNTDSDEEIPIFIRIDKQEVYIDIKDKLKKLDCKIPKKGDIGFDEKNQPNLSLICANLLCREFYENATEVYDGEYTGTELPIDIVFIDGDDIPKKGKITPPSKEGKPPTIKIVGIAKKV